MKEVVTAYQGTVNAFQDKDFKTRKFMDSIKMAEHLWQKRIDAYIKENGDRGGCVLAAGIYVHHLGHRKRRLRDHRVINPASLSSVQGEGSWSQSHKEIVEFLKGRGIHCWFEYGYAD